MAKEDDNKDGLKELFDQLPIDRLRDEVQNLTRAGMQRAVTAAADKVEDTSNRLTAYTENGGPTAKAAVSAGKALNEGKSPVRAALGAGVTGAKEAISQAFGGGSSGNGGSKVKVTNIVESLDVGVPIRVAYNQWTQFQDFPSFMKKVETVDAESDKEQEQRLNWKAQVFWSHRSWETTIVEQVADRHIVWKSSGEKGRVDGAVSFHQVTPNLTRILMVLEYYPQGLFERTGNLWRAQGRRARLELKHFGRHVMTRTLLNPEDAEGWRGEVHDGEVVKTHEQTLEEERDRDDEEDEAEQDEKQASEDEVLDENEQNEDDDRYEEEDEDEEDDDDDDDEGGEDEREEEDEEGR